MPKRKVSLDSGLFFHFINLGSNRELIFLEPEDYLHFLRGVQRWLAPVVEILAYCLMPTHYHILGRIRQDMESSQVSAAMQRLGVSHASMINKRYDRIGPLFKGRFEALPVTEYAYLSTLCLYIHSNPVKARLVGQPEEWVYSNYLEWIGLRDGTLVERTFVDDMFGGGLMYRTYMMEMLENWRKNQHQ